jgi:hypothetical protein
MLVLVLVTCQEHLEHLWAHYLGDVPVQGALALLLAGCNGEGTACFFLLQDQCHQL